MANCKEETQDTISSAYLPGVSYLFFLGIFTYLGVVNSSFEEYFFFFGLCFLCCSCLPSVSELAVFPLLVDQMKEWLQCQIVRLHPKEFLNYGESRCAEEEVWLSTLKVTQLLLCFADLLLAFCFF